jgi:hypothetical protein
MEQLQRDAFSYFTASVNTTVSEFSFDTGLAGVYEPCVWCAGLAASI